MTTRNFSAMLNEYLPMDLLKEELIKRDYILTAVEKDGNYKNSKIIVPFKAAGASSIAFGALTDSTDIAQSQYVRGEESGYKEVWGSMKFDHRDILDHSGKVKEQTFLKMLPDTIEDFSQYMKEVVSVALSSNAYFAKVTDATNAATGIMIVDKIERFNLGQKAAIDDNNSAPTDVYVTAINLNTNEVTFSLTRGGAAADLSAYSVAQVAVFYHPGVTGASDTFNSLKGMLLSAANGGTSTIHGVSKLAYPFTQAINVSGAAITAANILEKLFDAWSSVRVKGRGSANEILVSYKHFGSIMKSVENTKSAFKVTEGSRKASLYGWTTIEIMQVATNMSLKVVGIQELDDDAIFFIDWKSFKFYSNGFFQQRTGPEGQKYFEVRGTTGYAYILDISLFGQFVCHRPGANGVVHSISY